jgi:hypothetical protein
MDRKTRVQFLAGTKIFLFATSSRRSIKNCQPVERTLRAPSPREKQPECVDGCSGPSSTDRTFGHALSPFFGTLHFPVPESRNGGAFIYVALYALSGDWGSIPSKSKRFFCTPQRPDRLWVPPSLSSNGHWGFFPRR